MNKSIINRREFVGKLAATAALLEPAARALSKPQEQKKSSGMKVGLYSITYLGIWYRGEGLSLEDVI